MKNMLREKRKELKLRMIDVALKSNVGISTLWLIENGYQQRISNKTKKKIASALNSTVRELFGKQ